MLLLRIATNKIVAWMTLVCTYILLKGTRRTESTPTLQVHEDTISKKCIRLGGKCELYTGKMGYLAIGLI